jgi:hypothetical protein
VVPRSVPGRGHCWGSAGPDVKAAPPAGNGPAMLPEAWLVCERPRQAAQAATVQRRPVGPRRPLSRPGGLAAAQIAQGPEPVAGPQLAEGAALADAAAGGPGSPGSVPAPRLLPLAQGVAVAVQGDLRGHCWAHLWATEAAAPPQAVAGLWEMGLALWAA